MTDDAKVCLYSGAILVGWGLSSRKLGPLLGGVALMAVAGIML